MQFGKDRRSGQEGYRRVSPWGGPVGRFWNPENKIPCSAPPFGELVAVNVNTGEIAWKVPIGASTNCTTRASPPPARSTSAGRWSPPAACSSSAPPTTPASAPSTRDRQAALGDAARGQRALDPDRPSGQGRPPVRGRRRRRRQLPRLAQRHQDRRLRAAGGSTSAPCGGGRAGGGAARICRLGAAAGGPAASAPKKHVLAWADVRNGYQHESITPRAGHDRAAGLRVGAVGHQHPHRLAADHQAADPVQDRHRHRHRRAVPGPQPDLLRRDLLLRRARDRSRRPSSAPTCCRSSGTTARASWRRTPARPRSSRGRSSARCSAAASTSTRGASPTPRVVVEDRASPIRAPAAVVRRQRRALPAQGVLARASCTCWRGWIASRLDLKAPLVHRTDGDFPVAWTKTLRRRAASSTRRSATTAELWDEAWMQTMYAAAMKWVLKL